MLFVRQPTCPTSHLSDIIILDIFQTSGKFLDFTEGNSFPYGPIVSFDCTIAIGDYIDHVSAVSLPQQHLGHLWTNDGILKRAKS